jgi:hypothetical protein
MKPGRPPRKPQDARQPAPEPEITDTTDNELKPAQYLLNAVRASGDKELQLIGGLVQVCGSLLARIERDEKTISLQGENIRNLNNRVRSLEERTV